MKKLLSVLVIAIALINNSTAQNVNNYYSTSYSTTYVTNYSNTYYVGNTNHTNPVYDSPNGCQQTMSCSDFQAAKQSIEAKSFDSSRLTLAKQIIKNNRLQSSQIREIMELMTFESSKLEVAKYAWNRVRDKGNYYKLNDAFTFESSIDELNRFTESHS